MGSSSSSSGMGQSSRMDQSSAGGSGSASLESPAVLASEVQESAGPSLPDEPSSSARTRPAKVPTLPAAGMYTQNLEPL